MLNKRKTILYIACSLDGYIAAPEDDLGFLSLVQKEGEDYGYAEFIRTVDTVILGRKTYDWVMKQVPVFPHADKETYVLTGTKREDIGLTRFYTGDIRELVFNLQQQKGQNIFIDGGAETIHTLLKLDLIDEMIVSVVPILLGQGLRLFREGIPTLPLSLLSSKSFDTGLVQLHYQREQ